MSDLHHSETKSSRDSISKNTLFKVILGGIAGTLLAKVVTFQSMARAFGMSTGAFIISCVVIALLISILMRLKSMSVQAAEGNSAPGMKEYPTAEVVDANLPNTSQPPNNATH